ncbi:hypothetical protein like AT5G17590 [Hibiscus trionum]|uniref:Uncharacterized protein n=1 Tax=Hibiscus trionum TaxID=183268 RepID=A0A9W7LHC7_HIBTR|nr:hypothetical protein like AT5G17590 [Hibiscus trionum]
MQETIQGDARIYIVTTFFFVSIVTGGAFLCLYMFQPEEQSTPWYPVVGIVLVGVPWIFWIATYMYRCVAHCLCASNREYGNKEHNSLSKKKSCASEGHAGRSIHSSENEGSPSVTPDGDRRHVRFGDVVVVGSKEHNWDGHDGENLQDAQQLSETEHEGKENFQDGTASDKDHIAAASPKGEEPLIVLDSA